MNGLTPLFWDGLVVSVIILAVIMISIIIIPYYYVFVIICRNVCYRCGVQSKGLVVE
jgi:hypothetical protein